MFLLYDFMKTTIFIQIISDEVNIIYHDRKTAICFELLKTFNIILQDKYLHMSSNRNDGLVSNSFCI